MKIELNTVGQTASLSRPWGQTSSLSYGKVSGWHSNNSL